MQLSGSLCRASGSRGQTRSRRLQTKFDVRCRTVLVTTRAAGGQRLSAVSTSLSVAN